MSDSMHSLLAATPLLDLHHPDIQALVGRRGWRTLRPYDRIGTIYDFVRNDIAFGYNEGDELPASGVLADGIGQCNTKSTLPMALVLATPSRPGRRKGWHCRQFWLVRQPRCLLRASRLQPVRPKTLGVRACHPPCDEPQRHARPRLEVVKPHNLVTLVVPRQSL